MEVPELLKEPVFIETDTEKVDAILYQAMFDEVIRLRKTARRRERNEIRKFITEAYQLYAEKNRRLLLNSIVRDRK